MYFLIKTNSEDATKTSVVAMGQARDMTEFKKDNALLGGSTGEYFEIPNHIYTRLLGSTGGILGVDGSTTGITYGKFGNSGFTGFGGSGNTAAAMYEGDYSYFDTLPVGSEVDPAVQSNYINNLADFNTISGALSFGEDNENETSKEVVDIREHPNLTLSELQEIKELEAENEFIESGLGLTATISYEKDDGSTDNVVFDTRRKTIHDLQTIKEYKDLNLSLISSNSQNSISNTKIQMIDSAGTIHSVSSTEFDKILYSVLEVWYGSYITRTDMKNVVSNPVGVTDQSKKNWLNTTSNVSFSTSSGSSFQQESTGK